MPSATALLPVAYCAHSNTIFHYEERDLFSGELFCPRCSSRTDVKNRAQAISQLRERFPAATVYSPVAVLPAR